MPIGSVISQPAANSINAAYRPIVLRVTATNTDGSATPPVVYCDIYLNDVFYKTISKTQYTKLNGSNTEWQFDIQDALQEYLQKFLADNGETAVQEATLLVAKILCKFRSSGLDDDGFIETEDTAPIQGTDDVGATAGTGTSSNTFYGVNATLQHEDNQDLADHLDTFKHRTWGATTYPLTHRPDRYKVCLADSDSFPILTDKTPTSIRLIYTNRDGTTNGAGDDAELPCIPVGISSGSLPDATADSAYNYVYNLTGTAPFALDNIVKPAWMDIDLTGSVITISGMPDSGDIDEDIEVSFDVTNCTSDEVNFTDTIDVVAASTCDPLSLVGGAPVFSDAQAGSVYNFVVNLNGDAPFAVTVNNKPAWMTVSLVGAVLTFGGTPSNTDLGTGIVVDVTVINCSGTNSERIFDTITVTAAGQHMYLINDTGDVLTVTTDIASYSFTASGPGKNGDISVGNPGSGNITINVMTGTHDVEEIQSMPTPFTTFPSRVQGNVITLTNIGNTNYLWFKA